MIARALRQSPLPLLALLCLCLGACSAGHSDPEFRVLEARVEETSPDTPGASVVAFYLEGINESREGIPLRDIRFTATVQGKSVEVRRAGEATLGRFSTRRIRVPAAFDGQTFAPGDAYSISGIVRYEAQGTFARTLYDAGWVDHSVSFSGSGTLAEPGQAPVATPDTPVTTESRPTLKPREPVSAPAETPAQPPAETPAP
jgi:hypothetical protein